MRKALFALVVFAVSSSAMAATATLIAHNQRSSSGSLSTLKWSGCTTYTNSTPCINPGNANLSAMGITASTAVWDWDAATGVLSMTGSFNTASTIGSSGSTLASAVIGDKVTNLTINTTLGTTSASTYACAEGNFLSGVGAHGCGNLNLGSNGALDSSIAYNVGGNANCVQRTVNPDDFSTGDPRGLFSAAAAGGCDAVAGAFDLWTVVQAVGPGGGTLIISNGVALTSAGTNYLTFNVAPVPVPAAVWLFGSGLGLLGFLRRRALA